MPKKGKNSEFVAEIWPGSFWNGKLWVYGPNELIWICSINSEYANPMVPIGALEWERPVDELTTVLWAYSTHINILDQANRWQETMQRTVTSISWFFCSIWPLDCGWNPEDRLAVAPMRVQDFFQKTEKNCSPWSETTSTGSPWSQKKCWRTNSAFALAEGSFGKGMKCVILNEPVFHHESDGVLLAWQ